VACGTGSGIHLLYLFAEHNPSDAFFIFLGARPSQIQRIQHIPALCALCVCTNNWGAFASCACGCARTVRCRISGRKSGSVSGAYRFRTWDRFGTHDCNALWSDSKYKQNHTVHEAAPGVVAAARPASSASSPRSAAYPTAPRPDTPCAPGRPKAIRAPCPAA